MRAALKGYRAPACARPDNSYPMARLSITDDTMIETAYRARSAALRGMAGRMSAELRATMLDAARHWETLAEQAETLARSKKLIEDWKHGRNDAYAAASRR